MDPNFAIKLNTNSFVNACLREGVEIFKRKHNRLQETIKNNYEFSDSQYSIFTRQDRSKVDYIVYVVDTVKTIQKKYLKKKLL